MAAVIIGAGVVHGHNMFNFPYYENDEGVYVAQAWAAGNLSRLSPYTYWYDHAPAGWLLIALWQKISGGVFTFGMSVNSGRVLMWGLHVATAVLLYLVAKKAAGSRLGGVVAVIWFSLSPLAIYYQRRVLLDNVATFWVMLAVWILTREKLKLWTAAAAAATFGIAVLSKEVAIFFVPAFSYLVWNRAGKNRSFIMTVSFSVCGLVIGLYFLLALLKGEFWPRGFGGEVMERVSMVDTFREQMSRGVDFPFWDRRSLFYSAWKTWETKDPIWTWGGTISLIAGGVLAIRVKKLRVPAIFGWSFAAFLLTSRLIIDFYILPMIPFVAWCFGAVAGWAGEKLKNMTRLRAIWVAEVAGLSLLVLGGQDIGQFRRDENFAHRQAVEYAKANFPIESVIVADSSIYLDLKLARFESDPPLLNTHWSWKVEKDPGIYGKRLNNDWRNVDYILVSHETLKLVRQFGAEFIKAILDNSVHEAIWINGSTAYLDRTKYISTNGDWMGVNRVKDDISIVLDQTWKDYKERFVHDYGMVVDPATGQTTSEGQAYAMLRAVWMGDKKAFDGVWGWTRDHLQHRSDDKLLSWLWKGDQLMDFATATDADLDAALALVLANKKWGEEKYLEEAKRIMAYILAKEVVRIDGRLYLTSGSGAKEGAGYLVNPSYFSPAHYRTFAEVDPEHPWMTLVQDTYWLVEQISTRTENKTGLVPNWIWVDEKTGQVASAGKFREGADDYGFDAFRLYFRVALDRAWFSSEEALKLLSEASRFLASEWKAGGRLAAVYGLDGTARTEYASLANSMGAMAVFLSTRPELAEEMYEVLLEKKELEELTGWWGDMNNYYDQNWAWLGYALHNRRLNK